MYKLLPSLPMGGPCQWGYRFSEPPMATAVVEVEVVAGRRSSVFVNKREQIITVWGA